MWSDSATFHCPQWKFRGIFTFQFCYRRCSIGLFLICWTVERDSFQETGYLVLNVTMILPHGITSEGLISERWTAWELWHPLVYASYFYFLSEKTHKLCFVLRSIVLKIPSFRSVELTTALCKPWWFFDCSPLSQRLAILGSLRSMLLWLSKSCLQRKELS